MSSNFRNFDEFFLYYLRQHMSATNRWLHACGTAAGVLAVALALLLRHPWFALLWLPLGYGFAWFGHLLVERNQPATWSYPAWSFVADFRMLGLMLTGGLDPWLTEAAQAGAEERGPAQSAGAAD
ncbi:MAG: Mpo1-like protein [Terriglobales bacterium]